MILWSCLNGLTQRHCTFSEFITGLHIADMLTFGFSKRWFIRHESAHLVYNKKHLAIYQRMESLRFGLIRFGSVVECARTIEMLPQRCMKILSVLEYKFHELCWLILKLATHLRFPWRFTAVFQKRGKSHLFLLHPTLFVWFDLWSKSSVIVPRICSFSAHDHQNLWFFFIYFWKCFFRFKRNSTHPLCWTERSH